MRLSTFERKILNSIQQDLPFVTEPFKALSKQLGIGEKEFLEKIRQLKAKGIIRNFSAAINHRKLEFKSTLIGLRVPLCKVRPLVKKLVGYPEITHCFLRQAEYNLWLVFISPTQKRLNTFLKQLAKQVGRENILNLVTKKQFKLKTTLKL